MVNTITSAVLRNIVPVWRSWPSLRAFSALPSAVLGHYSSNSDILHNIIKGINKKGLSSDTVTLKELASFDQFHIGGLPATLTLFAELGIKPGDTVLDIGCGLGGPARACASTLGCRVVGVDINPEYIDVGNELSSWPCVGVQDRVSLHVGDAAAEGGLNAAAGVCDASIDSAYMLHVGMNIEQKPLLAQAIYRALKPGGRFACFDLMAPAVPSTTPLVFPLPFASGPESCSLATAEQYKEAFFDAGFTLKRETNKLGFVTKAVAVSLGKLEEFASKNNGKLPPLTLAVVMGPSFEEKLKNCLLLFKGGGMTATELVWEKPK